jgi:hypothetical protein
VHRTDFKTLRQAIGCDFWIASCNPYAVNESPAMTTLIFDMQTAFFHNVTGKAPEVMESLSIKWEEAHPQPIFAAWKFVGCTNVPKVLPAYLSKLDVEAAAEKGQL